MAGKAECLGTVAVCAGVACYFWTSTHGWGAKSEQLLNANSLPAQTMQIDGSDQSNRRRTEFVGGLIANGVISRVNIVGNTLEVSTGPAWNNISPNDRQGFIREIASQYSARDNDLVLVQDGQTGNLLGTFVVQGGGLKFD